MNGDLGTVLGTSGDGNCLAVRLDSGKVVFVPLPDYSHLRLGYAFTAHKAQGITCDRAFVLLGDAMQDLHLSYVPVSRARHETHLFVDRSAAGNELSELVRGMERGHEKTLAHEVADGGKGLTRVA